MVRTLKNYYHLAQALIANLIHGFPGRKLVVIGVTGTDGKTTTTNIIYHILKTAGKKTSMISTISAVIGGKAYDTGFHTTTPSAFAVQKYLSQAVKAGSEIMVLEVTSHALDQHRAWGVPFRFGVITNVTHEHMDYHKTYDHYIRSKAKLLHNAKVCVVNRDDISFSFLKKMNLDHKQWITYGMEPTADINPKAFPFKTSLQGTFNQYNSMAAIAVAKELGIPDETIRKALLSFGQLAGRNEIVYDKDFTVIIDFAHTPNALKQILTTVKEEYGKRGKIIHVFGSAGERDAQKRPEMGKNSATVADVIILTAEDPRSESVDEISAAIESGIMQKDAGKTVELYKINNRQEAITKAIRLAKKGDVVVITGKGHEQSMNFGNGEEHWDDHEGVEMALKQRNA